MPTIVHTPDAAQPMPAFSQAVISKGFVFGSTDLYSLVGLITTDVREQTVN